MRGEQAGVEIFRRIYIIISSIPDILNSSFEREFYWTFDHERGEFPTSTVSQTSVNGVFARKLNAPPTRSIRVD